MVTIWGVWNHGNPRNGIIGFSGMLFVGTTASSAEFVCFFSILPYKELQWLFCITCGYYQCQLGHNTKLSLIYRVGSCPIFYCKLSPHSHPHRPLMRRLYLGKIIHKIHNSYQPTPPRQPYLSLLNSQHVSPSYSDCKPSRDLYRT